MFCWGLGFLLLHAILRGGIKHFNLTISLVTLWNIYWTTLFILHISRNKWYIIYIYIYIYKYVGIYYVIFVLIGLSHTYFLNGTYNRAEHCLKNNYVHDVLFLRRITSVLGIIEFQIKWNSIPSGSRHVGIFLPACKKFIFSRVLLFKNRGKLRSNVCFAV